MCLCFSLALGMTCHLLFEKLLQSYLNQSNTDDFSTESKLFSLEYSFLILQFVHEKATKIVDSAKCNSKLTSISSDSKHGKNGYQLIEKSTSQNACTEAIVSNEENIQIVDNTNKRGAFISTRNKSVLCKKSFIESDLQNNANIADHSSAQCKPTNVLSANNIARHKPQLSNVKFSKKTTQTHGEKIIQRFDISSSSDFPLLLNSSSATFEKKSKNSCHKDNRKRIKPTTVSNSKNVSSTSPFNLQSSNLKNIASSSFDADITVKHKSLMSARFSNSRKSISDASKGAKVLLVSYVVIQLFDNF